MDEASLSDPMRFVLKAATRDLVTLCGGLVRAAGIAGVGKSQMARYSSPDAPDMIDVYRASLLERECGVPHLTRALAEAGGRTLGEPAGEDPDPGHLMAAKGAQEIAKAEAAIAWARAASDGKLTPAEARDVHHALGELVEKIADVRTALAPGLAGNVIDLAVRP